MALEKLRCVTSLEKFHQIGSLFFLHDQGNTAESSRSLLKGILNKEFEFDHIRVIYPQAPDIIYQVAHGGLEPGLWYERNTSSPTAMERMDSIDHSCSLICHLIDQEKARGIPFDRIVIGGFGMGGNLAMHVGFRYLTDIAGVFAHSSIFSTRSTVFETIRKDRELNKDKKFPALFMWNGRKDKNWLRWAAHAAESYMDLKIKTDFHVNFAMQGHEIISDEMFYLRKWVERIIPCPDKNTKDQ